MKKLLLYIVVLALLFSAVATFAAAAKAVKMQGQMVCMWCDVVVPSMQDKKSEPHKCMAAFQSTNGKVYTLVPDKVGKQLGDIKMHEQKVELNGYVLPNTQILEVTSFKVIKKVKPVTPEQQPWFNF